MNINIIKKIPVLRLGLLINGTKRDEKHSHFFKN